MSVGFKNPEYEREIKILKERLHSIEDQITTLFRVVKKIGERRVKECFYLSNGYCMCEKNVVEPSQSEHRRILEKNGEFHPFVDWSYCYLCEYYTPKP